MAWTGPIRVASIPANHPYMRHLAALDGEGRSSGCPIPRPTCPIRCPASGGRR